MAGNIGGDSREGEGAEQEDGQEKSGNRHRRGVSGVPVNTG